MKRYALIGGDVSASLSPEIHENIFRKFNISATYELLSLEREEANDRFHNLRESGYDGFNITAPYKQTILPFLDEISKEATDIGAVNTVKIEGGKMIGFNTDVEGFIHSLPVSFRQKDSFKILLLGAGGAARAILSALSQLTCVTVYVWNRTHKHAEEMVQHFQKKKREKISIQLLYSVEELHSFKNLDMVVNATTVPFLFNESGNIAFFNKNILKVLKKNAVLYDIKYGDEAERWKHNENARDLFCLDGRTMLFYQAIYAHVRWGNINPTLITSKTSD